MLYSRKTYRTKTSQHGYSDRQRDWRCCRGSVPRDYQESTGIKHIVKNEYELGSISEEQGEIYHQEIKTMEDHYKERWDTLLMTYYCWNLKRDCSMTNSKIARKRTFRSVNQIYFDLYLVVDKNLDKMKSTSDYIINV